MPLNSVTAFWEGSWCVTNNSTAKITTAWKLQIEDSNSIQIFNYKEKIWFIVGLDKMKTKQI